MKAQTIFNKVARHLLKQNKKSQHSRLHETCLYRGPNGLRCAIGAVIPDRLYKKEMEDTGSIHAVFRHYPAIVKYFGEENFTLLCDLQAVHDCHLVDRWLRELAAIASKHKLKFSKAA